MRRPSSSARGIPPLVFGDQLLDIFNTHTHVAQGPTSPTRIPVPLLTPAVLSQSTIVKT